MTGWTWNTLREMEALRREIDRAFDNVATGRGTAPFGRFAFLPGRAARAYPLMNIAEDTDAVYIEALAPGISPESLDVSVQGNRLTVSGEKHNGNGVKPEAYHRSERSAGRFTRAIELPVEVDADKVTAEYKHGILYLTLPKAASAKPKQIAVNVQ